MGHESGQGELRNGDRWATVSRDDDRVTSFHRHVVREGQPTSACGTTALPASIWRANTRKPRCPKCVERLTDEV